MNTGIAYGTTNPKVGFALSFLAFKIWSTFEKASCIKPLEDIAAAAG